MYGCLRHTGTLEFEFNESWRIATCQNLMYSSSHTKYEFNMIHVQQDAMALADGDQCGLLCITVSAATIA